MATIKPWVSSYQWPTNGWVPPVALSYRELTGEVSRADWVVFYTDRYAYSLACQYRVREGMTEQKAHKLCQAILNGIRVLKVFSSRWDPAALSGVISNDNIAAAVGDVARTPLSNS
ncbi:MAG: hypothetical protein U1U88_000731 [Lawsonella clevelandensis]